MPLKKKHIKKYLVLLISFVILSCSTDADPVGGDCKVATVYFGNDIPPDPPTRESKYDYFYDNGLVSKVIANGINGGNEITIAYEFDTKGRPFKKIFGIGEQEQEHVLFTYASDYLEVTTLRISNEIDTTYRYTGSYFYVENPIDNKVYNYTDGFFTSSYTFKDGNVYEYGNYTVEENDTINTFYQRFFYDDQPNSFYVPEYHVAVYPDFFVATITSKNNIVQVDFFGTDPPFSVDTEYDYDSDGRLIRFKGSTGNTAEFEYDCN